MERGPEQTFGDLRVRELRFVVAEGPVVLWVDDRELHYRVRRNWTRGEAGPRIEPGQALTYQVLNSQVDVVRFSAQTSAAAFEVTWPGGHTIVPSHPGDIWRGPRRAATRIELGRLNCFGYTVPTFKRPRAHNYRVTALYPDGSRAESIAQLHGEHLGHVPGSADVGGAPVMNGPSTSSWLLLGVGLLFGVWLTSCAGFRLGRS